ncbi:hypothetical protein EalM132_00162 [Exiguobacterium phage vB_EalM-132]|nr:hypothetical protein EalM132_00162 [Exiguobacterium phage vB_EalM-132]
MNREEKHIATINKLKARLRQAEKEYALYKKRVSGLEVGTKIRDTTYEQPMIVSDPHYSDTEFSAEFATRRGTIRVYKYYDQNWVVLP